MHRVRSTFPSVEGGRKRWRRSRPTLACGALLLCVACASARINPPVSLSNTTPETPPARVTPVADKEGEGRNPSGAQIDSMLRASGLEYDTLEPGHRWKLAFAGKQHALLNVYVLYSNNFTVILGKLCTLGTDTDKNVYRTIARRNFDLEQMKLSVNSDGEVFASFEVPTRILDRRELLENIVSLAAALDSMSLDAESTAEPRAHAPVPEQQVPSLAPTPSDHPVLQIRWDVPGWRPDQVL